MSLRDSQSITITVLINLSRASQRDILSGVYQFAKFRTNWNILPIHSSSLDHPSPLSSVSKIPHDGIITAESSNEELVSFLENSQIPIVSIGTRKAVNTTPTGARVAFIQCDDAQIGRFGAKRLSSLGQFASCAYVGIAKDAEWSNLRKQNFLSEFVQHSDIPAFSFPDNNIQLDEWLSRLPKPAAIMTENDDAAKTVLDEARRLKIDVPRTLAVIGVDNNELICDNTTPPLTSIRPDCEKIGYTAAQQLDTLLSTPPPRKPLRVLCSGQLLIERESARPIVPAARIIRDALRFINKKATTGITSDDVAAHLGVSRRLLYLRFSEFSNLSIGETIRKCQLKRMQELLQTTSLPIGKITFKCGFADETYPKKLFQKHFGMSMREWRKQNPLNASHPKHSEAIGSRAKQPTQRFK